ncbi:3D domain-containing protein [Sedimentibacter hydroxybenzoicus DSM 7310]|uniref:3D domain-containing protein n=1 Tax=Sedimentibacter hydroxybenzoicus DSM 7310 TaxID=1123245 RepID=A0A974BJ83_SEDHY|nr:3D domain-containing protein [Sedimentibacter hydroxybenzoicus]NYB73891.1 3D domain-containing protein [Sedimentibacter hydroxybenzoicus DSM 7310]
MQTDIAELQYQNSRQAARLKDKQEYIEMLEIAFLHMEVEEDLTQEELKMKYVGEFEVTYYTAGPESTGKYPGDPYYGITASGTLATEGQTIAADWDVFKVGTQIYIDGIGYRVVEDKGGAIKGNRLDVYMDSHEAALEAGRHMADVWIVEGEK